MTRVDYLARRRVAIDPGMLPPLAAILAAAVAVAGLHGVETLRLAATRDQHATIERSIAALEAPVRRAHALSAEIAALRAQAERIAAVRGSGRRSAAAVAAITDRIPDAASVGALRAIGDGYALDGHAADLEALARLLAGLRRTGAAARLLSARADDGRRVAYTVEAPR